MEYDKDSFHEKAENKKYEGMNMEEIAGDEPVTSRSCYKTFNEEGVIKIIFFAIRNRFN